MKLETYEATVENGQIKLADVVRLPENTKVYVIVPNGLEPNRFHVGSPRLAQPKQAVDFVKQVTEDDPNASL
ncbi:MAG: hypothetical protein HY290_14155 [Planctomycetia bacterium]|nr:hypothetical protein [Planctomycetia bacterium]